MTEAGRKKAGKRRVPSDSHRDAAWKEIQRRAKEHGIELKQDWREIKGQKEKG
jgi:hypothetical protein